jgi:hypothetical protein
MSESVRPLCAWTGVNPDGDVVLACDRAATTFVVGLDGHRIYSCDEHLGSAKAKAQSGAQERGSFRHRPYDPSEAPQVHVAFA